VLRPAPLSLTLWAARTFGTATHSLDALRSNPDRSVLRLLVSHVRPDSPTLGTADLAFLEPPLTGAAWVGWALEVCAREQVDVLWVTREAEAAAAASTAFAEVGTRLLLPSSDALRRTAAKSDVYHRAESLGLPTCPWQRAVGPDQARAALAKLEPHAEHGICVKPDSGQGAVGVYRLVEDWLDLPKGVDLPVRLWLRHVARNPEVAWLALPWLPGVEHSVDVLRSVEDGLLAGVVRTKRDSSNEQRAWADPDLTAMSEALLAELGVAPLGNVQWREYAGQPALLEVNPRPSGGLFRSSRALGVDLLWAAIRLAVCGDAGLTGTPLSLADGASVLTTALPAAVPAAVLAEAGVAGGPIVSAFPRQHTPASQPARG
jgi:ATP-grasp in the biosynthetic pathway with Ter operon